MKRFAPLLFSVVLVAGCPGAAQFMITTPSADQKIVTGGISNLQPYLGNFKQFGSNTSQGDFLLGSCGCGDWRVLFRDKNGQQVQFPVAFYTAGDYSPTGKILVYGVSGDNEFSGMADQTNGKLTADSMVNGGQSSISAERTDIHGTGGTVTACIMCHVGDDPIYPLPDTHPQQYKQDPTICLECHSANGQ